MQAVGTRQSQTLTVGEINAGTMETMNCPQIRENLDALFGNAARLEETPAAVKRILFNHLQICDSCCRSFDVRVRFRSPGRDRIY